MVHNLIIVYDGALAKDVAEQVVDKQSQQFASLSTIVSFRLANKPKNVVSDYCGNGTTTVVCFILQTIENALPTEDGGTCLRFFKRKTNSSTMLSDGFLYTVLGLGDSNLLLDRQTTGPTDCNQVAQNMDNCLHSLGGTRWYPLGLADERVGLDTDVEPWFDGLLTKLLNEVDSAGTM